MVTSLESTPINHLRFILDENEPFENPAYLDFVATFPTKKEQHRISIENLEYFKGNEVTPVVRNLADLLRFCDNDVVQNILDTYNDSI